MERAEQIVKDLATFGADLSAVKTGLDDAVSRCRILFGNEEQLLAQLIGQIQSAAATIEDLWAEYKHDVIVASTTPTYAWIPFYGFIAGPVVAGVFGAKAVEALNQIHNLEKQINEKLNNLSQGQVCVKLIYTGHSKYLKAPLLRLC